MPVILLFDECVMVGLIDDLHNVCCDEEQEGADSQNKEKPGLKSHSRVLCLLEFSAEFAFGHYEEGSWEDECEAANGDSRYKLEDEPNVLDENGSCHLTKVQNKSDCQIDAKWHFFVGHGLSASLFLFGDERVDVWFLSGLFKVEAAGLKPDGICAFRSCHCLFLNPFLQSYTY